MTNIDRDRAAGALLGLAVGDALGAPLEFTRRDSKPRVTRMLGGGPFGLAPGEWTDDTSMALCLADSLIERREFNDMDVMNRFVRWWKEGENSVNGRCFDIGSTTQRSLTRFVSSGELAGDGPEDPKQAGNGSLMRLAPVVLFALPDADLAASLAVRQSRLTHPAQEAHDACAFFARLLAEAIAGAPKEQVFRKRAFKGSRSMEGIAAGSWKTKEREEISSSGYVIHTLEAALWCVHRSETFEEALVLAVNLGEDADTVGAVTGQLAGALWGKNNIPGAWLDQLAWRERIEHLARELIKLGCS